MCQFDIFQKVEMRKVEMWKFKCGNGGKCGNIKAEVPLVWNRLKTIEMSQKKSYNKPSKDKSDKRKEPSHEIKNGRSWENGI
mgnify:FL=1